MRGPDPDPATSAATTTQLSEVPLNSTLQDQVVVVTGRSKGIGLACAQASAVAGAKVALVARSRANLDAALAAMPAARHAPVAIVPDLAGVADAARMVEEAVAALGELDRLRLAERAH